MKRKRAQIRIRSDRFWNCSSKCIAMHLHKGHLGKHANALNAASQSIVIDIELFQERQSKEFRGETASQLVEIHVNKVQIGQTAKVGWNCPPHSTALKTQELQIHQQTKLCGDGSNQIVRF